MEIDPRPPEGAGTEPVPVTVLAGIVVDGVRAAAEPKDGSNLHHQVGAGDENRTTKGLLGAGFVILIQHCPIHVLVVRLTFDFRGLCAFRPAATLFQ